MNPRKALLRAYKEEKRTPGIYAVRCERTGQAFVGATENVATRQNGVWFSLRLGSHPNARLQGAWNAHGEASFAFEVLETIDDDGLEPRGRALRLADRRKHWCEVLNAVDLVR
ncbi:GIY-YIG nuclease family protein [Caulobacter endophyticus]|uniref:GIY-YIG nuclease family protein n=1 Tax=Caulobacter endophyticus TaxID=2172652 RepID=UPI00240F04F8|nr:GIY-YIG nuclease family protein [Caulobacter endophyticus]MDG2531780.1 GIY-YIG nuclease family protein [Caulobacter endophyticus]